MTKTVKRRNIIIAFAIAILLAIAGVFCVFRKDTKAVKGSAEDPTLYSSSDSVFFLSGAAAGLLSTNVYSMRYTLFVAESVFDSNYEKNKLVVTFLNNEDELGCSFFDVLSGDYPKTFKRTSVTIESPTYEAKEYDLTHPLTEEDETFIGYLVYITLEVPLQQDVALKVSSLDGDRVAISSTRNLYYLWKVSLECGDITEEDDNYAYIKSVVDYVESKKVTRSASFEISDNMHYSVDGSFKVLVSFPAAFDLSEFFYGWSLNTDLKTQYTHIQRYLTITRCASLEHYYNLSIGKEVDEYYGSDVENFYFALDETDLLDKTQKEYYKENKMKTVHKQTLNYFSMNDITNGVVSFEINKPKNVQENYYYYVSVVDFYYTRIGTAAKETYKYNVQTVTPAIQKSLLTVVEESLERDSIMDEAERLALMDLVGIKPSSTTSSVFVFYKRINGDNYGEIGTVVDSFSVPSAWVHNASFIWEFLGFDYSDFNVYFDGTINEDDYEYIIESRMILTADSYRYEYNSIEERYILTIEYAPFRYSDLGLYIRTNDLEDNNRIFYYTSDNVDSSDTGLVTVTFNMTGNGTNSSIRSQIYNRLGWMCDGLDTSNVSAYWYGTESMESCGIAIETTTDYIRVTVPREKQDYLQYLSLSCLVEVVQDEEIMVDIQYFSLQDNGNGIESVIKNTEKISMWKNFIIGTYENNFENFNTDYGDLLSNALKVNGENVRCLVPKGIKIVWSSTDLAATIVVHYDSYLLFDISNNYNNVIEYKSANDEQKGRYYGDYFVSFIPEDYYVAEFIVNSESVKYTYKEDYLESYVDCTNYKIGSFYAENDNNISSRVIPIEIVFSDSYALQLNYFKTYISKNSSLNVENQQTPFAVKAYKEINLKLANLKNGNYGDSVNSYVIDGIYDLIIDKNSLSYVREANLAALKDIFELSDTAICYSTASKSNMIDVSTVEILFNGVGTYTFTFNYGTYSVVAIDQNGNRDQISIPLTTYAEWQESFGVDWTAEMLNSPNCRYFVRSTDISNDQLYGLFSFAVFKQKVSDIDTIFAKDSFKGSIVMFKTVAYKGSSFYKACGEMEKSESFIKSGLGKIGMFFGETFGSEKNEKAYTYYFYADGTAVDSFVATNGAKDIHDTDSAKENIIDDVIDKLTPKGCSSGVGSLVLFGGIALLILLFVAPSLFVKVIVFIITLPFKFLKFLFTKISEGIKAWKAKKNASPPKKTYPKKTTSNYSKKSNKRK